MAKKSNAELEEYLKSHNVDVPPPKTEFRDKRMEEVSCPLCKEAMVKTVRYEEHSFGEMGMYQCSECGTMFDICNMVNSPAEFSLVSKLSHGSYFQSIRTIMKEHEDFNSMPKECSIHHVEAEKQKIAALKDARMDYCKECKSKFTPQKSCIAVIEYCQSCRKDIPKDDARWKKISTAKKTVKKTVKNRAVTKDKTKDNV